MKSLIILILILLLTHFTSLIPCTVFFATDGVVVLGGNNEDWSDPNTMFWFIPSSSGKYGWVKFGFAGGYPQGGMNDQGLFWDATACGYLEMPFSETNKEKHDGSLMQRVMEECSSINEALIIFQNYYCDDQYRAQYLVGDKTGVSIIVEGDSIIRMSDSYQVMTNFYQSHPELGGFPCWRYETAVSMLSGGNEISANLFGSVLSVTHQEGRYPTQYSNIYDLKECIIYLFYYHNFEEFITINLQEELNKGAREYVLPNLFSSIQIVSPEDNQAVNPSSVKFVWKGKGSSTYDLCYSTDSSFSDCESFPVTFSNSSNQNYILIGSFVLGILLILVPIRKRGDSLLLTAAVLVVLILFNTCTGKITAPDESNIEEISTTITNLKSNTTYYWKVIAHPTATKEFSSESLVHRFITAD